MKKRGQVTVFIILGIVIVVFVIMGIVIKNSLTKSESEAQIKEALSFSDAKNKVRSNVEDCLKATLIELVPSFAARDFNSMQEYEQAAANFVKDRAEACIDLRNFQNFKIDANLDDMVVNVYVNDARDKVTAEALLDVKITSGGQVERLNKFSSTLNLKQTAYKK